MGKESRVRVKRERERERGIERERESEGGYSRGFRWKRGNATEPFSMSACSRHQEGGARGEQDQSKCPCSGMSPRGSVLQ